MSYALRNTLILLTVLLLIVIGGTAYIYFYQLERIEQLETDVSQKRSELNRKQQIANQYETVLENFENARFYFNNYDKALYPSSDEDMVFDFVNNINEGRSFTDFAFSFEDSTIQGQYGYMTMQISGEGYYRNMVNFVRKIELSKPLNKIKEISITPINELEEYGRVDFDFMLEGYYDRAKLLEPATYTVADVEVASLYNPFYPHIRDIQPNDDNLINIEQSDLLALSADRAFLLDQSGYLQNISIGDQVYLGRLTSINLNQREATFVLNKGGIIERITMNVDRNGTDEESNQ